VTEWRTGWFSAIPGSPVSIRRSNLPSFQVVDAQRRTIREFAARAAWETSRAEEARGDRGAAVAMARRARELDPDNEEIVRRLMELLDRRGDRGGALKVYGEWQARLLED
jgi:DNA-binding SARP family transcriptional activator